MKTFKQFITEGGGILKRLGNVVYSAPSKSFVDYALQFKQQFENIVATLKPPELYRKTAGKKGQQLKVDTYRSNFLNKLYLQIRIPIPDELEPADAEFFSRMAVKTVNRELGEPETVQAIDRNGQYFKIEELPNIISRRHNPTTLWDIVIISIVPSKNLPEGDR